MEWLGTWLNFIPNPVVCFDRKTGKGLYANQAAMSFFRSNHNHNQYTDVVKNVELAMSSEDLKTWQSGLMDSSGHPLPLTERPSYRACHEGNFGPVEIHWRAPNDIIHHFYIKGAILPAKHGYPEMGVVWATDVTNLVRQREQLNEMIMMRDDFITVASHELRTPLTSALLQTQHVSKQIPKEYHDKMALVERGLRRLQRLVENLLQVSRMSSPRQLVLTDLDFCQVVRETVESLSDVYKSHHTKLSTVIPDEAIQGRWDRERLDEILGNLLGNALKYGDGKPVEVTVVAREEYIELRVRDYGIGIKEEDLKRIFQRFERAVNSSHYGGLGLGLWLAREAARSMGGNLWAETPPGRKGTVFVLNLPYQKQL